MENKLCHFEIATKDVDKAKKFYTTIFDWKINWDDKMNYGMIDTGAPPGGGLFKPKEDQPLGISLYILVESIEESLKKVEENGGKVVVPKTGIPTIGWFAYFSDLDGNLVGVFENLKETEE